MVDIINCRQIKAKLPDGFTLQSLKPEHTEFILNEWMYLEDKQIIKDDYQDLVRQVKFKSFITYL